MSVRILVGDARERLAELPDGSVHVCVTSPPYMGLRDYGTGQWEGGDPMCDHRHETAHQKQGATSQRNGRTNAEAQRNENFRDECGKCGAVRIDRQIGLEGSLAEYIVALVEVFRAVRRVLRDDGTCWLNLGSSYGPDKCDLMVPARVALALIDDGWTLRSDIIWAKTAPMPESVADRPTSAHEHVFLLSKRSTYFYDQEAVREPNTAGTIERLKSGPIVRPGDGAKTNQSRHDGGSRDYAEANGRNLRNVWHLGPEPFPLAHFATFVTEIPRRCIKAGSSERGVCGAMIKKLRLRADLTDEQRATVYARLGAKGLA